MKKVIKHILRILGWMILGIIILLVLVSLLIQTRPVKNKLADVAENQSSKFIHGELAVGKIDGNFFTEIILEDFLVSYNFNGK
jgi:translocation and assembly module TamB